MAQIIIGLPEAMYDVLQNDLFVLELGSFPRYSQPWKIAIDSIIGRLKQRGYDAGYIDRPGNENIEIRIRFSDVKNIKSLERPG